MVGQERVERKRPGAKNSLETGTDRGPVGAGLGETAAGFADGSHGWSPIDGLVAASPGSKTRHWRMKPIRLRRRFPRIGHSASGSDWRWVS